jgi:hypothetical protein
MPRERGVIGLAVLADRRRDGRDDPSNACWCLHPARFGSRRAHPPSEQTRIRERARAPRRRNGAAMAKQTGRCPKCGHSYAYHYDERGEIVCSQCIENDRMAPCSPEA